MTDPRVEAALEQAVALGERNVQVAAYLDGELIVDASIGSAGADAVYSIFSVTKAVTATAVHLQAERGLIDYDAPLADYWPEYGTRGKEAVTVRHVLTHRAGVPQMPAGVTPEQLGDWEWITGRLAEEIRVHPPGTKNTYLSMTFGWLLGEIVRRTDPHRRAFSAFVAEELCAPLGIDALWLGVPEDQLQRVAPTVYPSPRERPGPEVLAGRAVPRAVDLAPAVFNRPEVQTASIPAVGGIADARSVARLFALLAGHGEQLLSPERVEACLEPRPDFELPDETYQSRLPVGMGGYWIVAPGVSASGSLRRRILAHTGAGGSIGWAELDRGLSVAICHDRMFNAPPEPPFAALGDAVRALTR
jgi:CubicO group peptidase (beta-lactamase class C family)